MNIYAFLLRLYPEDYRTAFGQEMTAVFAQAAGDRRGRGCVRWLVKEYSGLLRGAGQAWIARLAGSTVQEPPLDLRKMRPPAVSKAAYGAAIEEVIAARKLVDDNLGRMQQAIADCDYVAARFYSGEDLKARENLRLVRKKYRIAD